MEFSIDNNINDGAVIKVIGVGGGGGNAQKILIQIHGANHRAEEQQKPGVGRASIKKFKS